MQYPPKSVQISFIRFERKVVFDDTVFPLAGIYCCIIPQHCLDEVVLYTAKHIANHDHCFVLTANNAGWKIWPIDLYSDQWWIWTLGWGRPFSARGSINFECSPATKMFSLSAWIAPLMDIAVLPFCEIQGNALCIMHYIHNPLWQSKRVFLFLRAYSLQWIYGSYNSITLHSHPNAATISHLVTEIGR